MQPVLMAKTLLMPATCVLHNRTSKMKQTRPSLWLFAEVKYYEAFLSSNGLQETKSILTTKENWVRCLHCLRTPTQRLSKRVPRVWLKRWRKNCFIHNVSWWHSTTRKWNGWGITELCLFSSLSNVMNFNEERRMIKFIPKTFYLASQSTEILK